MIAETANPLYLLLTGGLLVTALNCAIRREWAALLAFGMAAVLAGMAGSLPPAMMANACAAYAVLLATICGGWLIARLGFGPASVIAAGVAAAAWTAPSIAHIPGPHEAGMMIEHRLAVLIR